MRTPHALDCSSLEASLWFNLKPKTLPCSLQIFHLSRLSAPSLLRHCPLMFLSKFFLRPFLPRQTLTLIFTRSKQHKPSPPSPSPHDDPPFSRLSKQSDPKPLHSSLPFDFRHSYSESDPNVKPIGFREPIRFSPFGPGRLDRKWDGSVAPVTGVVERVDRNSVLGEPLSEAEMEELVEKYRHSDCSRQINLGKNGVTHNALDDIRNHWKRAEAVRIKCLGVPTLEMDNVCFHLEDKTGGKIIYRKTNILLLYRGRNYDPKESPAIPLMLWKPLAPIYPRLVPKMVLGLTFDETKELRNRGLNSPALMKLSRNGVYVNVVERVREAFKTEEVVRLDCAYVGTNDCKKIGVKLRDLVPCVPLLFKDEQIILWRGKNNLDSAE